MASIFDINVDRAALDAAANNVSRAPVSSSGGSALSRGALPTNQVQTKLPTSPAIASGIQRPTATTAQTGNFLEPNSPPLATPNVKPPAAPAPAPAAAPSTEFRAPQSADSFTPGALMRSQFNQALPVMQQNQSLGQNIQQQGQQVAGQQGALANSYNQTGQNFSATATKAMNGLSPAPAPLTTSQLGAAPTIGQIANVAGQLGSTPQAAGVGTVAGRLGAAPQVAGVGNIQMAAGPGGVMPQLGSQGASNADQQGMLARLNGFLDAPEGPSVAEAQLRQAQASNMADLIGAARSGRGGPGAQALALQDAMSAGAGIASDTAGQAATLRAQEADMLKNRQLSAIGLGGDMATAQRGQDLGFRGQNLAALQGDQSAALAGRGQDLQAAMANQGTQTALEQLRAQTALGARGQNLAALQGDQGTAAQMSLGQLQADVTGRGQNLAALQGDQSTALGREGLAAETALGARAQDLSLLQGNQQTALGARGQNANVLTADADRNLAAQRLGLDAGLGYGNLANQANQTGLNYLSQANQQGVMTQGMTNDLTSNLLSNQTSAQNALTAGQYGLQAAAASSPDQPGFWEQLALNATGGLAQRAGAALVGKGSDERSKTDIKGLDAIKGQLDDHLRAAPGYSYRYRDDNPFGEDPGVERAGPMAQDLEKSPFGRDIVFRGPSGMKMVDTGRLSLVNHAALASMRSELDKLKAQLEA
jgi:hypothetical protein